MQFVRQGILRADEELCATVCRISVAGEPTMTSVDSKAGLIFVFTQLSSDDGSVFGGINVQDVYIVNTETRIALHHQGEYMYRRFPIPEDLYMNQNPILHRLVAAVLLSLSLTLLSCGGNGDGGVPPPSEAERIAAASATAQNASECTAIQPFYWEIGDSHRSLASGSAGGLTYTATSSMNIASASKWLYGAYVVEVKNGVLTSEDIKYLNFQSGYTSFTICLPANTVSACATRVNNGDYTMANDDHFYYGGGHMQQHAVLMGLGSLDNAGLAAEIQRALGSDIGMTYSQPQPAGGVVSTAEDYAKFLRKLLSGDLQLGAILGSHPVCTNPLTCTTAISTPVPTTESWHYSLGHWVEDDPVLGDGAFSSAGAFGFYPWIDEDKTTYGILAREAAQGAGVESVSCGRLIRKAWLTGAAQ